MKTKETNTLVLLMKMSLIVSFLSVLPVAHAASIHVTKSGSPAPDGSESRPYHMVEAGIVKTRISPAKTVEIEAGEYYETFTTDTPCTLTATGGTVTIGQMDYKASTTLDIITLNTHLCGDVHLCTKWCPRERAEDISFYIRDTLQWSPDVVCFQEIWDDDLFLGDPGDWEGEGILTWAGYRYGEHGTETDCLGCWNSGLAIMSQHPMAYWTQFFWGPASLGMCDGWDCMAGKGWVQTKIEKEEFNIWIVNLHADAGESPGDKIARILQFARLHDHLFIWKMLNPSHVFFVMGDFNVYGHHDEYMDVLINFLGSEELKGRDAVRNSPGFTTHMASLTYDCSNDLAGHFDDECLSGRLDYIFYFPPFDGSVEVLPMDVNELPFQGRWLTEDGVTTNDSSDHYGVYGRFKLIRKY